MASFRKTHHAMCTGSYRGVHKCTRRHSCRRSPLDHTHTTKSPLADMREALLSAAALCALVTLLPGAVTWEVDTGASPPSRTELRKMMARGDEVNGVMP